MFGFYQEFYNKQIAVEEAPRALEAWLHEHVVIDEATNDLVVSSEHGLQFIPAYDMLVPHVASVVEFADPWGEILRVHLEVHTGKWNTEMWDEVVSRDYLAELLKDFFGICNPKEDQIIPVIGLFRARFMRHKNPKRLISYPPCTCRGCDSPICPVRKRRRG